MDLLSLVAFEIVGQSGYLLEVHEQTSGRSLSRSMKLDQFLEGAHFI